jgi:hypothetical protein
MSCGAIHMPCICCIICIILNCIPSLAAVCHQSHASLSIGNRCVCNRLIMQMLAVNQSSWTWQLLPDLPNLSSFECPSGARASAILRRRLHCLVSFGTRAVQIQTCGPGRARSYSQSTPGLPGCLLPKYESTIVRQMENIGAWHPCIQQRQGYPCHCRHRCLQHCHL